MWNVTFLFTNTWKLHKEWSEKTRKIVKKKEKIESEILSQHDKKIQDIDENDEIIVVKAPIYLYKKDSN